MYIVIVYCVYIIVYSSIYIDIIYPYKALSCHRENSDPMYQKMWQFMNSTEGTFVDNNQQGYDRVKVRYFLDLFNPFFPTVPIFAVQETASLGIMGAPRVPPLNPSKTIVF